MITLLVTSIVNGLYDTKSLFGYLVGYTTYIAVPSLIGKDKGGVINIYKVLLLASLITSLSVILIGVFKFPALNTIFQNLLVRKNFEYLMYDLNRGRVYPFSPFELTVPILMWFATYRKNWQYKITLILSFFALFLSSYRARIVTTLMMSIAYALTTSGKIKLRYLMTAIIICFFSGAILMTNNVVNRLSLQDNRDVITITTRIKSIGKTINISKNNLLFGIGIGNYVKYSDFFWRSSKGDVLISYENPHNQYVMLLVESGVIGLILYLLFVTLAVRSDVRLIRSATIKSRLIFPLIFSSWIYMVVSAFDWYQVSAIVMFMLYRGIIRHLEPLCVSRSPLPLKSSRSNSPCQIAC